jgi:hypothetical protein
MGSFSIKQCGSSEKSESQILKWQKINKYVRFGRGLMHMRRYCFRFLKENSGEEEED